MHKIEVIRLRTPAPEAQIQFYSTVQGMHQRVDGTVGYSDDEAGLLFEPGEGQYEMAMDDLYWKVSISVPNIDLACSQLAAAGIEVDGPQQLGDVAYLAHFEDPAGFKLELIDHWFEGDRPEQDFDERMLGGGPRLNLLTLRSNNIEKVEAVVSELGMTRLSIVPVLDRGFTLYFYGFTDEQPPSTDLYALANRTWVYQHSSTVLEVQHRTQAKPMARHSTGKSGYAGALIGDNQYPLQSSVERVGGRLGFDDFDF